MSNRITVYKDRSPIYNIVTESSFKSLQDEMRHSLLTERKVCIVTDTNVAKLYLDEVTAQLKPICSEIFHFVFPAGEASKTLNTVRNLYQELIYHQMDRSDLLIALGGGVVGDLCGYTAATYLRGVDFIQIPTTLLAQVDSSIGGKTGVDFDSYKNMVGAFHMPKLVYMNLTTLLTLPDEQFASGMGEIIKHGLMKDASYYQWLISHAEKIWQRDLLLCEEMVIRSDQIKAVIVEADPHEKGERALLNFGHTLGHAIEKQMQFQMLHGHCVALGCIGAAYLSCRRNLISDTDLSQIRSVFELFQLPISICGMNAQELIAATKLDKKMESGVIKFILLRSIGNAYVDKSVSEHEMVDAISYLLDKESLI